MIFKENLENYCFSCFFSLKNHWFYCIYNIFKWFHWKHSGVALEVLILIHPYFFASTIFMNEAPGLVGLSFWIVSWFFVLVGSLVRHPMVFDNCFNQKLGCARLIRSELNSIHQFTWDHMIGMFSWELSVELPCVEQFFGKPTTHPLYSQIPSHASPSDMFRCFGSMQTMTLVDVSWCKWWTMTSPGQVCIHVS